jgi:hypothetical protein
MRRGQGWERSEHVESGKGHMERAKTKKVTKGFRVASLLPPLRMSGVDCRLQQSRHGRSTRPRRGHVIYCLKHQAFRLGITFLTR